MTRAELRRRAQADAAAQAGAPAHVDAGGSADAAAPAAARGRGTARARFVAEADATVEDAAPLTLAGLAAVADRAADGSDGSSPAIERLADLGPDALGLSDLRVETPLVAEPVAHPAAESVTGSALPAADAFTPPSTSADETAPIVDEFEEAARLFSFTGETPVQVAASALAADEQAEPARPRRRGLSFRRAATASFSIGVVGAVGLLTVGMTTPLEAVAAAKGTTATASLTTLAGDVASEPDADDIQAYVAPADVQNTGVQRADNYQTTTIAELAAESGISNPSDFFVNDPNSAIQWPFAVGVPISYGFGMRSGTMHEGLDFVPGEGAPVQAIADGTVRIATESGGAFGVTVLIDHVIDGELVSSRYGHMQYGSLQVETGQQVTVGTFIGRTGNTGRSFGAHTHFEILQNGTTPIDPLPWLREHAGG